MSMEMWQGLLVDEKKRRMDAEAALADAMSLIVEMQKVLRQQNEALLRLGNGVLNCTCKDRA